MHIIRFWHGNVTILSADAKYQECKNLLYWGCPSESARFDLTPCCLTLPSSGAALPSQKCVQACVLLERVQASANAGGNKLMTVNVNIDIQMIYCCFDNIRHQNEFNWRRQNSRQSVPKTSRPTACCRVVQNFVNSLQIEVKADKKREILEMWQCCLFRQGWVRLLWNISQLLNTNYMAVCVVSNIILWITKNLIWALSDCFRIKHWKYCTKWTQPQICEFYHFFPKKHFHNKCKSFHDDEFHLGLTFEYIKQQ